MSPKINPASKFIKNVKNIKKGTSNNKPSLTEKNKLRLDLNKLKKEDLDIEREALKTQTVIEIRKTKESVKSIEKEIKELNLFFSNSRMTKKEKNEYIKEALKDLLKKRRENKDLTSKIEIQEELIKSTGIIINKTKSEEALDAYQNLVVHIEKIAKTQFGNSKRSILFQNHALKEITLLLQKSDNIPLTFREIYKKLN